MKRKYLLIPPILGLSLLLMLLWSLTRFAGGQPIARAASLTVCPAGTPGCGFNSIQAAVDAASNGDVILVATGVYTDVHGRPRNDVATTGLVTQVMYIDKSLTIRGGYTTSFSEPPDPAANPTILDAQGRGRVLYVTSVGNITVEGLSLAEGNAANQRGGVYLEDAGGGVYIFNTTITLRNNHIVSSTSLLLGGGLYLYQSVATLVGNTIAGNFVSGACPTGCGRGGGLVLDGGTATLISNTISGNGATYDGGLSILHSSVLLVGNTISNNSDYKSASGVFVGDSPNAILINNTITDNNGPGLFAWWGTSGLVLIGNTISDNHGTGLVLWVAGAEVIGNTISGNAGGGVDMESGAPTLKGNTIISNTGRGGVYISNQYVTDANPTLINNFIANNQSNAGSGVYIIASSARLLHNTLVGNTGGDGSGIYIASAPGGVTLTNTILVSHTVGISVTSNSSVTLDGILWFNNGANTSGDGFITITHAITGDPNFALDGYHILSGSAAIDAGIDAQVSSDIDYQPRPYQAPDLGADEYWPPGTLYYAYLPLAIRN